MKTMLQEADVTNLNLYSCMHISIYISRFSEKEKDLIKAQWTEKMIEFQKHILFFDFLQTHYLSDSDNILNVVKIFFIKKDKSVVKSSHSPLDTILVDCKGFTAVASPFKDPNVSKTETKKNH